MKELSRVLAIIPVLACSLAKHISGCHLKILFYLVRRVNSLKTFILLFANVRGRLNYEDLPASKASGYLSGRVEIDFLVFKNSKCVVLEVDGQHHQPGAQTIRDYVRDRVLLITEGIPTARFTAQECLTRTADVVTEFLELF